MEKEVVDNAAVAVAEEVAASEGDAQAAEGTRAGAAPLNVRKVRRQVKLAFMNRMMAEVATLRREVQQAVRRRMNGRPARVGDVASRFEVLAVESKPAQGARRQERRQTRRRVIRELALSKPLGAEDRARVRAMVREAMGLPVEDAAAAAAEPRSNRGMRPMERRFKQLQRVGARKIARFEPMGDALPEGKREKVAWWRALQTMTFDEFREVRMARREASLEPTETA